MLRLTHVLIDVFIDMQLERIDIKMYQLTDSHADR